MLQILLSPNASLGLMLHLRSQSLSKSRPCNSRMPCVIGVLLLSAMMFGTGECVWSQSTRIGIEVPADVERISSQAVNWLAKNQRAKGDWAEGIDNHNGGEGIVL